MTGTVDYLSDGERTYAIHNGHSYLGNITGSGCTLGTTIAAFLAVHKEDRLLAALSGILMYEIAAEQAAVRGRSDLLFDSFSILNLVMSRKT
jgi:thiamine-phosphate diphosphorylase/hydroxyethylthiazole kinase